MRRVCFAITLAGTLLLSGVAFAQGVDDFEARTFQGTTLTLPYRLFKVQSPEPGKSYPLILFLHGSGERGDDNTAQLTANAGATVWATPEHQAANPAYVIAPQCPLNQQWVDTDWALGSYSTATVPVSDELTTALEIADAVAEEFPVDPQRLYITGLSMGGYGTWDAIIRNPMRFAAAIPICGAGDPSQAVAIAELPIWTAHGDADSVVPVSGTRDMVAALTDLGSTIQYSEYPGVNHDSWSQTYANEAIISWLFEQQRPLAPGSGGAAGAAGSAGSAGSGGDAGTGGETAGTGGVASNGGSAGSGSEPPMAAGSAGAASAGTSSTGGSASTAPPSPAPNDGGCCSVRPSPAGNLPAVLTGVWFALVLARRRSGRRSGGSATLRSCRPSTR